MDSDSCDVERCEEIRLSLVGSGGVLREVLGFEWLIHWFDVMFLFVVAGFRSMFSVLLISA